MTTSTSEPRPGAVRATYQPGVHEYRDAYFDPGYFDADTDIPAAFRVTPQPGVAAEEAAAALAAELSMARGPRYGPTSSPTSSPTSTATTRSSRSPGSLIG